MKKLLLMCHILIGAFLMAQVNYSQDWTATGLSNWTTTSSVFSRNATAGQICGTTGGTIRGNRYGGNAGDFTSPNIPGNNQGLVTMSFDYKITDWSAGTVATPAATIGTIAVQYSNNVGGPWVTAYTVNSTNHVTANTCATRTVTFSPLAGNLFVRFYVQSGTNDSYYYFDNVVMTQGAAPSCLAPFNLTLVNVSATNANISWTAPTPAPANGYDIYYNTTGVAPIATTPLNATNSVQSTTTTANIAGLTPITTYYVWVRAKCTGTDLSTWTPMPSFMTLCVPINALPWIENFDSMTTLGAGILPPCWKNVTGTSAWTSSNAAASTTSPGPRSAPNYVRIQYGNTNASQLWTPGFALTAGTTYEFSYYYHTGGTTSSLIGYTGNVLVNTSQSMTGATNLGTFITATQGTSAYTQYKVYYTPTTTGTYNFAVNTSSNFTPWYMGVDDFRLRVAPTCIEPLGVISTAVTANTASISWNPPTTQPANGYQIYYSTTNTPPATAQIVGIPGTSTSYTIPGLAPSTTYNIWVRAICSGTDQSDLSEPVSVMTTQIPATLPYIQNFTTGNDLGLLNGTQTNKWVRGNATGNPAQSLYISNDNGVTNAYTHTTSTVQAYRDITIPNGTTIATFSFDWKGQGEGTTFKYDYLQVWLVRSDFLPTPGTLITAGAGRVLIGQYNLQGTWQSYSNANLNLSAYAGTIMRLVFEWRNDGGGGTQPPAAIDNIVLRVCSTATPVVTVTAASVTHNSATITWPQDTGGADYKIRYRPVGTTTWLPVAGPIDVAAVPGTTQTYTFAGTLLPVTTYEVEVAAVCNSGNTIGVYSNNVFTTKCDPTPPNVVISNITATSALVTWNPLVANASYELRWRIVGTPGWFAPTGGTPQPPLNSYTLPNLTSFTTYEVQVRSRCNGTTIDNPWSNPQVFTTVRVCEIPPPGLTITTLTPTSAEVVWDAFTGAGATGSYILKYRKVGIPSWTTINVNTNTYTLTGLLELTKYEMQVANVCSGTPGNFTPPYYFTTPTVVYCQMTATTPSEYFINKVTVKPTGKTEMVNEDLTGGTYSDFTAIPAKYIELIQGSTGNQITVDKTVGTSPTGVAVWIDFNRNGYFDLNERIMADGPNINPSVSATFSVPADAFVSMTDYKYVRMRVAMAKDEIPVNCVNFQNGEVEDYTVRISKPGVANALNQTEILIYPNPVSTVLNVKNISKKANYKIYSAAGQVVSSGLILNNKIDVSRLINGVYVIDIEDAQGTAQKKFIKE